MSAGIALFSAASNSCIILPFFMREPLTLRGNNARGRAGGRIDDVEVGRQRLHHLKFKLSEDAESAPRELREVDLLRDGHEFLQIREVARRQAPRPADRPELRRHTRQKFLLLFLKSIDRRHLFP